MNKLYHAIKLTAFVLIIIVAALWLWGLSCQMGQQYRFFNIGKRVAGKFHDIESDVGSIAHRLEGDFESGVHDVEHGARVVARDAEHAFEEGREWLEEQV